MVYTKLEKTDFEVLGFMIKKIETKYSIKQIADAIKKPYVKVYKSIQRLTESSIIKKEIMGKSHYCLIDYKNNMDVVCFISKQISRNFLEKNKSIKVLFNRIKENIKFPDYSLVLFGSYAKGNANKHSDIDICIITSKENQEKAEQVMSSVKGITSSGIHSMEFSYNDFIEMLKSKKFNVGKEIFKDNIIFKGQEQFYDCKRLADEE